MVSVYVAHSSTTWPILRSTERLGVSVLAGHHIDVARAPAAKGGLRFAAVSWESTPDGAVFIRQSAPWLDCAIETEVPAGDHDSVRLRVAALQPCADTDPILLHGGTFRPLAST
jgi:flavin reductase (DIM6/NTAB) family NADH-FMN oxidoreductase RutF